MNIPEQLRAEIIELGLKGFDEGYAAAVDTLRELGTDQQALIGLALSSGVPPAGVTKLIELVVDAMDNARETMRPT